MSFLLSQVLPLSRISKSLTYEKWVKPPIVIYDSFYLFNVTNAIDVSMHGHTPHVDQVGPFVFRQEREKVNVSWSADEQFVTYDQVRRWYYEPQLSNGSLNDSIYHLNVPLVSSADYVRRKNFETWEREFMYYTINQMHNLTESYLFPRHTIGELMFEGYTDLLLKEATQLAFDDISVPFSRFGWLYGKNNTASNSRFTIYTGKGDLSKLGRLHSWNDMTYLTQFEGECNSLNGTMVDFVPPFQRNSSGEIRMFLSDICRPVTLHYKGQEALHDVLVDSYEITPDTFDYDLDENICYCPSYGCPKNGVTDISSCTFDTPSAASLPHFLHADPWYIQQVTGLSPNSSQHSFSLKVHPKLGIMVSVDIGFQVSVIISKVSKIEAYKNLTSNLTYLPVFWFHTTARMSPEMLKDLETFDSMPSHINSVSLILAISGFTVALITFYCFYQSIATNWFKWKNSRRLPIVESTRKPQPKLALQTIEGSFRVKKDTA